jgi:hypothetical protein
MITCIDCGAEEARRSPNHKRCRDCAAEANISSRRRASATSYRRVRDRNPETVAEAKRRSALKTKFGITPEQYDEMLDLQGGVCYICRRPPGAKRLAVDHDHRTGLVRGLLCSSGRRNGCNYGLLGGRDADPAMFLRAYEYLTSPPAARLGISATSKAHLGNRKRRRTVPTH